MLHHNQVTSYIVSIFMRQPGCDAVQSSSLVKAIAASFLTCTAILIMPLIILRRTNNQLIYQLDNMRTQINNRAEGLQLLYCNIQDRFNCEESVMSLIAAHTTDQLYMSLLGQIRSNQKIWINYIQKTRKQRRVGMGAHNTYPNICLETLAPLDASSYVVDAHEKDVYRKLFIYPSSLKRLSVAEIYGCNSANLDKYMQYIYNKRPTYIKFKFNTSSLSRRELLCAEIRRINTHLLWRHIFIIKNNYLK